MNTSPLVIYWARRDFRLADNRALTAAVAESKEKNIPLLCLFILENYMCVGSSKSQFGFPSRLFLAKAVPAFATRFPSFFIIRGTAIQTISKLSEMYSVSIHVHEDIYPDFFAQIEKLREKGISIKVYADPLVRSQRYAHGSRSFVFCIHSL